MVGLNRFLYVEGYDCFVEFLPVLGSTKVTHCKREEKGGITSDLGTCGGLYVCTMKSNMSVSLSLARASPADLSLA